MPDDIQAPQFAEQPQDLNSLTQGLSQRPSQGVPAQGHTPNSLQLIIDLAHAGKGQVVDGVPQRPMSRVDALHDFLGNFLQSFAAGMQAGGTGPGSNGRAFGAAINAPYQNQLQQYGLQQQQQAQQSLVDERQSQSQLRSAQASALTDQVTLPNGMTVPRSLAEKMILAQENNAAAQQRVETTAGASKANTQANIASREGIAAKGLAEKVNEFQTTDQFRKWKATLDDQTKKNIAALTASKAPAAMLQTATFAKGGLDQMATAEQLMDQLEASGVLGSLPANKVEDWIFGKGLVDPSLPASTRQAIGQLRAALGYTSSAAMRAHTGRTSQEIYGDFKSRLGAGQDWSALRGAITQTEALLNDYYKAASNENIAAIRSGTPAVPQPAQAETRTYNGATYTRSAPNQPWIKQGK